MCDQILTKYDKTDKRHVEKSQERHFLRIKKTNANSITQGLGVGFPQILCEWNACRTDQGGGPSAINVKSHSTPIKFNPLSQELPGTYFGKGQRPSKNERFRAGEPTCIVLQGLPIRLSDLYAIG